MPGYISELDYYGTSDLEFIELAIPMGTDVSGYSVVHYDGAGNVYQTYSLGTSTGTMGGHDVYVVDDSTPGFSTGDSSGALYADDAIALVDDTGTVIQFVSWEGFAITAVAGPANGLTSTNIGSITNMNTESLQSDDGGSSYYVQTSQNKGTIPACYAPGTLIDTLHGSRAVEALAEGDQIRTVDGRTAAVRWIWRQSLRARNPGAAYAPILIRAGALGPDRPVIDLVVSAQHRICVGGFNQLEECFAEPVFVPAKALLGIAGVELLPVKRHTKWVHIACDAHHPIYANGCASETLLVGPVVLDTLTDRLKASLIGTFLKGGAQKATALNGPPALPCVTVQAARKALRVRRTRRGWTSLSSANAIIGTRVPSGAWTSP